MKTIVTHDGTFHTDDIFAVAALQLLLGDEAVTVVRTRDQGIIEKADYVVDVGHTYDPKLRRFDHHQPGGAGVRPNGIQYASFGLVWKEYGETLCGSAVVAEEIDKHLVQAIDSVDNGVKVMKPIFEDVSSYTISDYLMSHKKVGTNTPEELYATFLEVVSIAKSLLAREIENEKVLEGMRSDVREAYTTTESKDIVVLPKRSNRHVWRPVISRYPEPLFVVYQGLDSKGDGWKVEAVSTAPETYELRKSFPASWGGKEGKELAEISGVSDAGFCHKGLFTASADTKDGAIAMAKIAIGA